MKSWEGLDEFVAVAECGSFSRAAERLRVSSSHVSRQVARLEERLQARLFYRTTRRVSLTEAGLLTALFIFPASLLRPVGGWFSDRFGPRKAMYGTFSVMIVVTGILMMPDGHIVIVHASGAETEHLAYSMNIVPFTALLFLPVGAYSPP